ncbi:hypothetical protein OSTOST_24161 [Ostertagia ostertagi]
MGSQSLKVHSPTIPFLLASDSEGFIDENHLRSYSASILCPNSIREQMEASEKVAFAWALRVRTSTAVGRRMGRRWLARLQYRPNRSWLPWLLRWFLSIPDVWRLGKVTKRDRVQKHSVKSFREMTCKNSYFCYLCCDLNKYLFIEHHIPNAISNVNATKTS